jgi:hypothetical protein
MDEQYKMYVMNRLCSAFDISRDLVVFQLNHVTEIWWNGFSVESLDIHQVHTRSVSADTRFIDLLGSLRTNSLSSAVSRSI